MKKYLLIFVFVLTPLFGYLFWHASTPTLETDLSKYQKAGDEVKQSLSSLPALPITEDDRHYTIEDTRKDGIQITYANQTDTALAATPDQEKPSLTLRFPKKYASDPIEVQIAEGKSIFIQDKNAKGDYTAESLSLGGSTSKQEINDIKLSKNPISWLQSLLRGSTSQSGEEKSYLSYTDQSKRITTYYAYGHDQATGEKQLKNWQVYDHPAIVKGEQVSYSFANAKLKKNDNGTIGVYYYGDQDLQNDKASADVDPSLMARAQRTLAKEMGDSIDQGTATPNFIIPKPYYITSNGEQKDLDWRLSMDGKDISIDFTPDTGEYPLALDPTLSFTAPGQSNTGDVITGSTTNENFGTAIAVGDLNGDGSADLVVGGQFNVYILYSDSAMPSAAKDADVIIFGAGGYFGAYLNIGDFNADGKIDLAIGAQGYSSNIGRVYIFYNDGSFGTVSCTTGCLASNADVMITGETTSDFFGSAFSIGDFNADGKIDLAIGARYSSNIGRVYIFYNDGSFGTVSCTTGCLASNADVMITGEVASDRFGIFLSSGDMNADSKTDLIVSAKQYNGSKGRVYIFYNDGSFGTVSCTTGCLASNADVMITGDQGASLFATTLVVGDFNADGRIDLAVSSPFYSTAGRVYIFYNDGSFGTVSCTTGCLASNADVMITGEGDGRLDRLVAGDFNADGRTDLVLGADSYSSSTGRVYIFYNDGSFGTVSCTTGCLASNADVIITGETTSNAFGSFLATGDFNADGKTDLVIDATDALSNKGKMYIFYSQNGQVNTNQSITGNASGDSFGQAMTTGDFNADGRIDLAVGAPSYSTNTGRVYIFYGDGQISNTAGTADVTITGNASGDGFGTTLATGDFNADGNTDLAVGASGYSSSTGRVYIFYNDGSIPTTAATADVTITGNASGDSFSTALTTGDFNADGRTDLIITSYGYSSSTGRTYIFYNDGSIPTTAATADVTITGEASFDEFGISLTAGDFNADGRVDFAVGATYAGSYGRVYIFYNDGSIPTTAATADVTITGQSGNSFGTALATGDLNADGRIDLIVGDYYYGASPGRVYIFYNDGSIPTTAATADVIISGESNSYFGRALAIGDFNADGRIDLAVGGDKYTTNTGRTYIFYNDGALPTTAATADVILTGEATNNYYGAALTTGDFNADGRTDLVVGAYGNATNTGKVYFYETRENFSWKLQQLSPDTGGLRTGLSGTGQELKITGNAASDQFGYAMTTGDFNSDGKTDLAVGTSGAKKVYIFYDDGSLSPSAASADVIITSGTSTFGYSLAAGDLNADGRTDLAVGAYNTAYIFYNDGSIPTTSATADVTITGNDYFGGVMAVGDFNADGRVDLAVGAWYYSSESGQVFIFYNDGSIPTTSATADATITGEAGSRLGFYMSGTLVAGDFNADGKTDLAVGGYKASSIAGRVYIFYNGSITTKNASAADVIITGQASSYLGYSLAAGDLNADGKIDLIAGGPEYASGTGRAYIFYADGTNDFGTATCSGSPAACDAANADVIITGEGVVQYFGATFTSGDFNGDGRTDLAVGAYFYSTNTGRTYIFYNGSITTKNASAADVILTGEATNNYFGSALAAGDLNGDGKTDLVVGAYGYSGSRGRAYIYTLNDPVITGETTNNSFGTSLVSGDFNADGKIDLAVGASGYSTNTGRVYIFYQDGTIPSTAASADVIITGEATGNYFGQFLTAGDLNADGKADLAVGAAGAAKVYIFYNDGSIPTTAATADVIISGSSIGSSDMSIGDLNSDGKADLLATAFDYSSNGRAYLFYSDGTNNFGSATCTGSAPTACSASNADIIVDGTGGKRIGTIAIGDVNADGRVDMLLGGTNGTAGEVYILYNDGSSFGTAACTTACSVTNADVIIAGENNGDIFGTVIAVGDMNADGHIDFVVSASQYSSNTGRIYIFYNDGVSFGTTVCTTGCLATNADVIITGGATANKFGRGMIIGDFNADGKVDLAVGAEVTGSSGRVYIFYNDGSYPSAVGNADITLDGEGNSTRFGYALVANDFNADGKTDLAVGAYAYSTNTGRVYLFTSEAAVQTPTVDATTRGQVKFRGQVKLR